MPNPEPPKTHRYRRALEGLLGVPATEGNRIDVLRNGCQIFPAMLEAIEEAESTIDFLTFVYWTGEVADRFARALAERAATGVRVRVLLDGVGARLMDRGLIHEMEEAGAHVEWFRKPNALRPWEVNHRTHRKVLICDEDIAFTGGVGIAEEWDGDARDESEWRDTHFRIRGPAVDGLRAAFLHNWVETERQPIFDEHDRFPEQPELGSTCVQVIRGAAEVGWSDVAMLVRALIDLSTERLWLTTAYFAPDHVVSDKLCAAAARGVDVRVLLPGPHADKRFVQLAAEAEYASLLEAGVRIWNYQPTMLHAKVLTVDSVVSSIGSANLNSRSMSLDEELNVVAFDPDLTAILESHFEEDLERSVPIEPDRWEKRGIVQRAKEAAVTVLDREI